ncbi:hypothetical protein IGI04_027153 [Brassica rapa subsp. trilocularis]|uniref:Uncharacterized protein n=1 Tax=Brassica rapa subsp. trilocularis TaxID=1813537 RepID=A0ABQ7L213_BRACM|nr:hypothetical protein IGI04_027153 [Brassica rapa subsp. trilocularis]
MGQYLILGKGGSNQLPFMFSLSGVMFSGIPNRDAEGVSRKATHMDPDCKCEKSSQISLMRQVVFQEPMSFRPNPPSILPSGVPFHKKFEHINLIFPIHFFGKTNVEVHKFRRHAITVSSLPVNDLTDQQLILALILWRRDSQFAKASRIEG